MVSLFQSMMELTMVACLGWFMKASMSSVEPYSSRIFGGGSGGTMETMRYGYVQAMLLLRL